MREKLYHSMVCWDALNVVATAIWKAQVENVIVAFKAWNTTDSILSGRLYSFMFLDSVTYNQDFGCGACPQCTGEPPTPVNVPGAWFSKLHDHTIICGFVPGVPGTHSWNTHENHSIKQLRNFAESGAWWSFTKEAHLWLESMLFIHSQLVKPSTIGSLYSNRSHWAQQWAPGSDNELRIQNGGAHTWHGHVTQRGHFVCCCLVPSAAMWCSCDSCYPSPKERGTPAGSAARAQSAALSSICSLPSLFQSQDQKWHTKTIHLHGHHNTRNKS